MAEVMDRYEHIVISAEAKKRIKLFSAKYDIPMKVIVEWFILSLIDENGDLQTDNLNSKLQRLKEKIRK